MYVRIGRQTPTNDLVAMLVECHGRIRDFLNLAALIAAVSASDDEVRSSARRVARYFREAFPLHLADEEEIATLLAPPAEEALERGLRRMLEEHRAHEALVARLVQHCDALTAAPERLVELRDELKATLESLRPLLEEHLAEEERTVFPALRTLPAGELARLAESMRLRRA
jgi:iron-sulfur cluster repair protein YtfE (RIC family)